MNNKVEFLLPDLILVNDTYKCWYLKESINISRTILYIGIWDLGDIEVTDQMDFLESIADTIRMNYARLGYVVATKYQSVRNEPKYKNFRWKIYIDVI